MILSMVGWGLGNPIGDIAVEFIDPVSVFVIELVSGLLLFFALALVIPSLRSAIKQVPWKLALPFGLIQPGLAYLLGNIGWQYGTVTTGAILIKQVPATTIKSAWRGDARITSAPKRAKSCGAVNAVAIST